MSERPIPIFDDEGRYIGSTDTPVGRIYIPEVPPLGVESCVESYPYREPFGSVSVPVVKVMFWWEDWLQVSRIACNPDLVSAIPVGVIVAAGASFKRVEPMADRVAMYGSEARALISHCRDAGWHVPRAFVEQHAPGWLAEMDAGLLADEVNAILALGFDDE